LKSYKIWAVRQAVKTCVSCWYAVTFETALIACLLTDCSFSKT